MVELYVGYTRDDTSRSISMLPCPPLNFKANEEAYTGFSPRKGIKQNRGVQQIMYAIFVIKTHAQGLVDLVGTRCNLQGSQNIVVKYCQLSNYNIQFA